MNNSISLRHFTATSAFLLIAILSPASRAQKPVTPVSRVLPSGTVSTSTTPQQKTLLSQMQDAFTNIAQSVEPTVVNIKAIRLAPAGSDGGSDSDSPAPTPHQRSGAPQTSPGSPGRALRRSEATGSGVIVRADGYILTNDHVIDQALGGTVTVTLFDGREYTGKVYPDYKSDLAIVKIDPGKTPLPVATFADKSTVLPGQWALAVGSPFDLQNTITVGIISAVGRQQEIPTETGDGRYYPDLIQTDAAINPGNSGGPLFNIDGKVVGINVAIESPVEGSSGVGFAIPVSIAEQVATTLISQGKITRGYLGLAPTNLTPTLEEQFGQTSGAFVEDVIEDSPAGKAGLQAGDIVTTFNGLPVTDEITFRQAIASAAPGEKAQIGYVRDGAVATAIATVAPPPPSSDAGTGSSPIAPPKYKLGVGVRELTASDRQKLNLAPNAPGVIIATVIPGSAAEAAGLTADMVIQKINETPVHNQHEFQQALSKTTSPSLTLIVIAADPSDQMVHQHAVMLRL